MRYAVHAIASGHQLKHLADSQQCSVVTVRGVVGLDPYWLALPPQARPALPLQPKPNKPAFTRLQDCQQKCVANSKIQCALCPWPLTLLLENASYTRDGETFPPKFTRISVLDLCGPKWTDKHAECGWTGPFCNTGHYRENSSGM